LADSRFLILLIVVLFGSQVSAESCPNTSAYKKRQNIVIQLDKLIDLEKDSDRRADLFLRKARIYLEQYYDCIDLPKEQLELAIKTYGRIIETHSSYQRLDEVIFLLASALNDAKRAKEALELYQQLIIKGGKFVPDALVAIGDFYFNQANMLMARKAYERAIKHENSSLADYAVYKLAWIHINLQEFEKAGQLFRKIIVKHDFDHKNCIREEALHDYVLAYSHFGRAEKAQAEFQSFAGGQVRDMLDRLFRLYIDHGKFTDTITVLRHLIKTELDPLHKIDLHVYIIKASARLGMKNEILLEVKQLAQTLQQATRSKRIRRRNYQTKYAEARQDAADSIARLAGTWEKEARYAPPLAAEQAEEILGLYLEIFPDTDQAYVMRIVYADFLTTTRKKYKLAIMEYERIIETDLAHHEKRKTSIRSMSSGTKRHPRGFFLCEAAYGIVRARQHLMQKEEFQTDLDFIAAAETYLKLCSKKEDVCQVRSALAHSLTSLHHFSQAREQLTQVESNCPDPDNSTARLQIEKIDTQLKDFTGIRFKPAEIKGKLSRALIMGVMYQNRAVLSDCFSKEPSERSKPVSWVLIRFLIAVNGYVAISKVDQSNLAGKKTGRCLEMQIRRLKFPPPPRYQDVKVIYRLEIAHLPTPQ